MVRSMEGQGCWMVKYPVSPGPTCSPFMLTTLAITPGSGRVAEPGFVGVAPGSGEIRMEPVSVCHQVSTMGQRFFPMASKYHFHAAGLMGSPTVPSKRRLVSLWGLIHSIPQAMNARTAVAEL